jgi:Alginate lyase
MNRLRRLLLTAALLALTGAPALATEPPLLMLDDTLLARSAERLKAGDASLIPAYEALLKRADKALTAPLRSVTDKTALPPSGSRHDYISRGPYWWPNPDTPNKLPYVRRDGRRNPEVAGGAFDYERLQDMIADTRDLTLAWRLGGQRRYGERAAAVLRTWFLAPATRMNPNLAYAQGIPGIVDGRGIGLIDTRDLFWVIDSAQLLARAGVMPADDERALKQWFAQYTQWFLTSEPGREEAAAYNNHGLFYDAQAVAFLIYSGNPQQARRIALAATTLRIAGQIDRKGRLPAELERTRPFHYTAFTLQAATRLARHAQAVATLPDTWPASDPRCAHLQWGCKVDLWTRSADGRSLKSAIDLLAQAVFDPTLLGPATPEEPRPPLATALPVLLLARDVLGGAAYDAALARLRTAAPDDVHWLLWPQR